MTMEIIILVKIRKIILHVCEFMTIFLSAILLIVVFYQVLSRYFISFLPTAHWSEELARFVFIWIIAFICGPAYEKCAYVGLDILPSIVSNKWQKLLRIINNIVVIMFAFFLVNKGWIFAYRTLNQTSPSLGLNMVLIHIALPFVGLNMIFFIINDSIATLRSIVNNTDIITSIDSDHLISTYTEDESIKDLRKESVLREIV